LSASPLRAAASVSLVRSVKGWSSQDVAKRVVPFVTGHRDYRNIQDGTPKSRETSCFTGVTWEMFMAQPITR